ncbi:nuclease A inhibitor family protein, partial [Trichocoleus sp. FACHB-262]|uniref:nuclease A inhibitor family protein n=2 Tax=Trichocoleusaceae TaxID=2303527 RepID=UPI0019BFC1F8|nr:nuclease [Trichocoleus sp. FACHB-262]
MSVVESLKKSSEGLLMTSESDCPFEVFLWEGQAQEPLTIEKLLRLTDHLQNSPAEIIELEYFFRNLAQ